MIEAVSLTRRFGERLAVDRVSLSVARGEIVALLGPNGAGKTTTLRMIAGLLGPHEGSVTIDGTLLSRRTGSALRRRIGFLPETPGLWDRLTVRENLTVYAGLYDIHAPDAKVSAAIETFGLGDRAHTATAELSKGMRQKVALARALLHAPDVLLLDEPSSGLDPEMTRHVRQMLEARRAAGSAIVVSTHNLDEAERLADRVALIQQRLLAIDAPAALRQRASGGGASVTLAADASPFHAVARSFDPRATLDGCTLRLRLGDASTRMPDLVAALVHAGAPIVDVRQDAVDLETAYLQFVNGRERTDA